MISDREIAERAAGHDADLGQALHFGGGYPGERVGSEEIFQTVAQPVSIRIGSPITDAGIVPLATGQMGAPPDRESGSQLELNRDRIQRRVLSVVSVAYILKLQRRAVGVG